MPPAVDPAHCLILQAEGGEFEFERRHFDPDNWRDLAGFAEIGAGRGGSYRIEIEGRGAVLRRYLRGGWMAGLLVDRYLWLGRQRSRPWREWQVLTRAREAGLPVPEPLAACVCRAGPWYRAALITVEFAGTETLLQRLRREGLKTRRWQGLGAVIRQLQASGIEHADLNGDNVLIDSRNRFYLIDFDRARLRQGLDDWQWRPLYRLQRSLLKQRQKRALHFGADDWQALMDGYQS